MKVPVHTILLELHNGWWVGTTEYRIGPDRPMSAQMREIQKNLHRFAATLSGVSLRMSKGRRNG